MANVSSSTSGGGTRNTTSSSNTGSKTTSNVSTAKSNATSTDNNATAARNENATTEKVDVNFKAEEDVKPGVNFSAWDDDAPAKSNSQTDAARAEALKEALGDSTLRSGMEGDSVEALQSALNDKLGYKEGDENFLDSDGKFGPKTKAAVAEFQKRNEGLKQDGIFGPNTRDALLSGAAGSEATPEEAAKAAEATSPEATEAQPTDEQQKAEIAKLEEALGSGTLRKGMEGDQVKALQQALNDKLGLKEGEEGFLEVDGKFGSGTQSAVRDFQKQNELGTDGIFGNDTRNALLGREGEKVEQSAESAPAGEVADRYEKYEQHRELLARAVAAEARGENFDTQTAVAQAIMNYANDKSKNLTSIVGNSNSAFLSSNQDGNAKFYSMSTGNIPNWERTLEAVDQALAGNSPIGADRMYFHDDSIGAPRWVDKSSVMAFGAMRFYEER